jgi:arylsulfatase A-like enzyme
MYRNYLVDYDVKYKEEDYAVSPENILGMDVREVLLPRVVKAAGYRSGIFGKWDLGQLRRFLPLQRGFDEFYGFTNTGIDYWTHERYGVPSMWRDNTRTTEDKGTYATTLFRREAVRFLKANHDRPFLLYVPFNAPHGASNLDRPRPGAQAPGEYVARYAAAKGNDKRKQFMGAVTCMDDAIGELLDVLDEHELAEDTIVIFFSDNGGPSSGDNTPLRGRKGQMFEGGIRVPCIVRWPRNIPRGQVCDEFLTSLEVFPTVLKATGVALPKGVTLDGFDMLPVLQGKTGSARTEMFWERRGDRAARVGHWKWVETKSGNGLFDLSADIGERNDLSKAQPEKLKQLKARFAAWKAEMAAAEPRRPFRDF